jgi:hypothetical protein
LGVYDSSPTVTRKLSVFVRFRAPLPVEINFKNGFYVCSICEKITTAKAMAWTMLTWKICRFAKASFYLEVRSKTHHSSYT